MVLLVTSKPFSPFSLVLINLQISTQTITYVGMFMEQVLIKLSKSLSQDLDTNLVVTGLFAKLSYHPILPLTVYLLSHQPNVGPNVPTLYGTLEKVPR